MFKSLVHGTMHRGILEAMLLLSILFTKSQHTHTMERGNSIFLKSRVLCRSHNLIYFHGRVWKLKQPASTIVLISVSSHHSLDLSHLRGVWLWYSTSLFYVSCYPSSPHWYEIHFYYIWGYICNCKVLLLKSFIVWVYLLKI